MGAILTVLYGIFSYAFFARDLLYAIGFVGQPGGAEVDR